MNPLRKCFRLGHGIWPRHIRTLQIGQGINPSNPPRWRMRCFQMVLMDSGLRNSYSYYRAWSARMGEICDSWRIGKRLTWFSIKKGYWEPFSIFSWARSKSFSICIAASCLSLATLYASRCLRSASATIPIVWPRLVLSKNTPATARMGKSCASLPIDPSQPDFHESSWNSH